MREKIIVDSLTNEGVTAKLTGFGAFIKRQLRWPV